MSTVVLEDPAATGPRQLSRRLLRHEIRRELLESLWTGRLSAGRRVTEKDLAAELGVSRTPLREALFGLEQTGFFETLRGKGLAVTRLKGSEVREIYPILGTLEGLALRSSGEYAPAHLERLNGLVEKSGADWSACLFAPCENGELMKELTRLEERALRYELAYARVVGDTPFRPDDRQRVVDLLARGQKEHAAAAVEELRGATVMPLIAWLGAS